MLGPRDFIFFLQWLPNVNFLVPPQHPWMWWSTCRFKKVWPLSKTTPKSGCFIHFLQLAHLLDTYAYPPIKWEWKEEMAVTHRQEVVKWSLSFIWFSGIFGLRKLYWTSSCKWGDDFWIQNYWSCLMGRSLKFDFPKNTQHWKTISMVEKCD